MPIVNVDLSNSLEFFRTVTNQCILAMNYITNNTYITTGTVRINPTTVNAVTLNVSNGIISGNGARIFSIPFTGITGQFLNRQIQNTTVTIASGTGVSSNGSAGLGGSPALLLVSTGIVDSKNNTSTILPASANSIRSLLDPVNTIEKTEGIFKSNVGGTGITSYTNGQILLTSSNTLVANTIRSNTGIIISNGAGLITVSANLVQGANILLTPAGSNGGILITQNALPNATFSTLGVVRLTDDYNTPSVNLGVSANALNTLSEYIESRKNDGLSINAYGRLIDVKTYTNGPLGNAASFVWTRPVPSANFAYAIITAVSPGGGSAAANNGHVPTNPANQFKHVLATGGGAGASIVAIVTADDLRLFLDNAGANTLTVNIGAIGLRGAKGGAAPGSAGTSAGNLTIGIRGTGDPPTSYLFHLEGGKAGKRGKILTVGTGGTGDASVCIPVETRYTGAEIARVYANNIYGTVLMKSIGFPGQPGILFSGGYAPAYTDPLLFTPTFKLYRYAVGGKGGSPTYPLPFGDGFFPIMQNFGTPAQYINDKGQQHIGASRVPVGGLPLLRTVQVSNTAANNQVSSVIEDTSTRLNYGMGGEGPYSLFEYLDDTLGGISTTRIDVAGANGGFGYVKIESYVNA